MKQLFPLLAALVFLGILVAAGIYLGRRFQWYFGTGSAGHWYAVFAAGIVFMIGGLAGFTNSTSTAGQILYILAATLMGFMLYLLMSVLLVHLLQVFSGFKPFVYGVSALALALGISVYATINAFSIKIRQLEIALPGLHEELRIMHWTDVHLGHFRGPDFLEKLVSLTLKQQVDAVAITGDLFDGKIRLGNGSVEHFRKLDMPVYFVSGNHDGYSGVEEVKEDLRKAGVHVLSNRVEAFGALQVVGLNHMRADENSRDMHAEPGRSTIRSVLDSLPLDPDRPSLLLHHSPHGMQYAIEKGIDLYLCGHTHGGQLFPVTFFGRLGYEYNRGLHHRGGTRIYVGEGAGTFGPPMRLGTRSSITLFKLKPAPQAEP